MTARGERYTEALDRAAGHAKDWLSSMPDRPIPPRRTADDLAAGFGAPLPEGPTEPAEVIDLLAGLAEPGLMAMPSGRFFGWVIGGTLPAALGADWLASAWDQNAGMRYATPAAAAAEEAASRWLLELLGLPSSCDVGFVTGATMANFTGLAAARYQVLADAGWEVNRHGLIGAPPIRVLVGAERHATVDLALRYLGLGEPTPVAADEQGRMIPSALHEALAVGSGPTIVCTQAGNLHSGAFDPIGELADLAHAHQAWVHVDGAFGLWAAAAPNLRHHLLGYESADSWATDAHKTLNVPYDCGLVFVADPVPLRSTFGVQTSYLIGAGEGAPADGFEKVPEFSRRARAFPVWAALRSLGRSGVAELVEGLAAQARTLAGGLAAVDGAEILNEVDYTQISVSFGSDELTRKVIDHVLADGTAWMSGSRWRGRDILRVSVSNWATDDDDVKQSVQAVHRAVAAARATG
jgi:glutamate/tyrosine decarboxylase-like PLP-dependent enzyme